MADTNTLVKRVSPWQAIGGSFELPDTETLARNGGQFIKEGLGIVGELITENVTFEIPDSKADRLTIGDKTSLEFTSKTESQQNQLSAWLKEQYSRTNQSVEQVTQMNQIKREARADVAGMNNPQFAKESGYKNYDFSGPTLRSIANTIFVTMKRIVDIAKEVAKKIIVPIIGGKGAGNKYNLNMKEGNNMVGTNIQSAS